MEEKTRGNRLNKSTKTELTPMTSKQAQIIFAIDKKINELYEKKDSLIEKIIKKSGPVNEIILEVGGEKPFARVKVIDQKEAFDEGVKLFKSAGISRYTSSISRLMKAPKGTTPIKTV